MLVRHSLAYEPLLDLLVQFARDIQLEFYPYFKEVFPVLVGMCECQDADLIQVYPTLISKLHVTTVKPVYSDHQPPPSLLMVPLLMLQVEKLHTIFTSLNQPSPSLVQSLIFSPLMTAIDRFNSVLFSL